MVAPEAIGPLQRYAALVAELPVIRLAEPLARELGLREGQIVNGSMQLQPEGVVLKLAERSLMLPPGWQRFATGDMRGFQFVRVAGGVGLKVLPPIATPSQASPTPVISAGDDSSMVNLSRAAPASNPLSAYVNRLMERPPSADSLFNVLRPGGLESMLTATPGGDRWAAALASLRLRVDQLSAHSIQQAFWASGLWADAAAAGGVRLGAVSDLKTILRQALRLIGPRAQQSEEIKSAIEDIERSQVDSILAQNDQRQVLSLMLPFADAEPVWLKYEREPRRSMQHPQRHVIDLHLRPGQIGDLWIQSTVAAKNIELTVWTANPEVAVAVAQFRDQLTLDLAEAGLTLQSFRLIKEPRSGGERDLPAPTPSSVDLRA